MNTKTKKKGPFLVETTTSENGHEETRLFWQGRLIHKRWSPQKERGYSKTFGKWGQTF